MATITEIYTSYPTDQLVATLNNTLVAKGVQSTNATNISTLISYVLKNKYGNVRTKFATSEFSVVTQIISKTLSSYILPNYMTDTTFDFGASEVITKTGTESDAGSFNNDPTIDDEYRSYPIDTTANDVQSKTRSIVNGAESGANSNVKTYNTTDSHKSTSFDYDNEMKYESLIKDFCESFVKYVLNFIRVDMTLCDPLSDDSTLLELEF